MRVFVAGAASWDTILHVDRLPTGPDTVFATRSYEGVGATGAGKALNLARLGHEVHLSTVLGDDPPGRRVALYLQDRGIHLITAPASDGTELHVNLMLPDGGRLSIYRNLARPRDEPAVAALAELAARCDAAVLNIGDDVRPLVPALVAAGVEFWTDLHDWDGANPYHADFLAASSIVLSDVGLGAAAARVCRGLANEGKLVVCTHGAAGATAWSGRDVVHLPAESVDDVVDTNGAGDALTAGLIHGRLHGWPLRRCLRAGVVAGATSVTSESLASDALTADLLARCSGDPS